MLGIARLPPELLRLAPGCGKDRLPAKKQHDLKSPARKQSMQVKHVSKQAGRKLSNCNSPFIEARRCAITARVLSLFMQGVQREGSVS